MKDEFWSRLLLGEFGNDTGLLEKTAAELDISENHHLPVLFSVKQWNQNVGWRDKLLLDADIKSGIMDLINPNGYVHLGEGLHLAVCDGAMETDFSAAVAECCGSTMCDVCCCVGRICDLKEIPSQADELVSADEANVAGEPLRYLRVKKTENIKSGFDMARWQYLLAESRFDELLLEIGDAFLDGSRSLDRQKLQEFNHDFLQLLYAAMKERAIPAHALFGEENSAELFSQAPNSIAGTLNWVFWAVGELSRYLESERLSCDYISRAKSFITANLNKDFTRADIAADVHLSQNHLARIFRKQTGMSISEYILQERMNLAFELLTNTYMPVSTVATRVGYENYSYFLTLFRRVTGMRPSEYREKTIKKE